MLPIAQSTRTMGACQGRTLGAIMRLKHAVHRGAPSAAGSARSVPTTARRAAATHAAGADAGASTSTNASTSASSTVRLAIVGDVHDQWSEADARALALLAPDAVLLLGDFGNEAVALVRSIARSLAALDLPKAVILGNHDAWYSMSPHRAKEQERKRRHSPQAEEQGPGNVALQLEALGSSHVGYGTLGLPRHPLTVAGARPFSKGGDSFSSIQQFMSALYGVDSFEASADKIVASALQAPQQHSLVVVAHNGPHGLGDSRHDICGVDFARGAGDHGDRDLSDALARLQGEHGRHVALVTFGHMHQNLKGGGLRDMVHVDPATGTTYLNAATVPRVRPSKGSRTGATLHHFLLVELVQQAAPEAAGAGSSSGDSSSSGGGSSSSSSSRTQAGGAAGSSGTFVVHRADEVWVEVEPLSKAPAAAAASAGGSRSSAPSTKAGAAAARGQPEEGGSCRIAEQRMRVKAIRGDNGVVVMAWKGHQQQLAPVILSEQAAARYGEAADDDAGEEAAAAVSKAVAVC